jgi:hypothetical protein
MTSTRPDRGAVLTSLLVVLAVGDALVLVLTAVDVGSAASHGSSIEVIDIVALALPVLVLVALGAIWARRWWGPPLFGILAVLGLLTDLFGGISPLLLLLRAALIGALFWAISTRWSDLR